MLVLSRYKDQRVFIGDDVVVTIVDVRGDRVRIGIEAPDWVTVDREEVAKEFETAGYDRRRDGRYLHDVTSTRSPSDPRALATLKTPRSYDLEVCLK